MNNLPQNETKKKKPRNSNTKSTTKISIDHLRQTSTKIDLKTLETKSNDSENQVAQRTCNREREVGSVRTIAEVTLIASIGLVSGVVEEPENSGVIPPPAAAAGVLISVVALPLGAGGAISGHRLSFALVSDALALLGHSFEPHENAQRFQSKESSLRAQNTI